MKERRCYKYLSKSPSSGIFKPPILFDRYQEIFMTKNGEYDTGSSLIFINYFPKEVEAKGLALSKLDFFSNINDHRVCLLPMDNALGYWDSFDKNNVDLTSKMFYHEKTNITDLNKILKYFDGFVMNLYGRNKHSFYTNNTRNTWIAANRDFIPVFRVVRVSPIQGYIDKCDPHDTKDLLNEEGSVCGNLSEVSFDEFLDCYSKFSRKITKNII